MNAKNTITNVRRLLSKGLSDLDSNDRVSLDDNQSNSEILFDLNDIRGGGGSYGGGGGGKTKGSKKK